MKRICLGVHVHAEPERLRATLASVQANTLLPLNLLLLPDGPDEETRRALADLKDLQQSGTAEPRGMAACFNRLVAAVEADVYVLLESGSLVAPNWLDYLLAALDADPHHGLAGPSTNHVWNEQGAFPRERGEPPAIARTAEEAARRFGAAWRALEPLHSLADFCYVVRREVVEAIGAADEGYGLGPCWEMDYNIRAARAGWRGVWACAAYVYRSRFTLRRQREERLRFEASRRRYQDKFCALRLLNQRAGYESHCRGDVCEHFAPRQLIQIQQPLPSLTLAPDSASHLEPQGYAPLTPSASLTVRSAEPLVSCIMPTHNRRTFIPQAIEYFLRQDYANKELIIVDDGTDPISDLVPQNDRIQYLRLPGRLTVGAKRNRACEAARGEIICHWDDDDWHAARRISYQVEALRREKAAVVGLNHLLFYDVVSHRAWQYSYPSQQRFWLSGSSLCYTRSFWTNHRFADVNIGEDARFIWSDANSKMIALPDHTFHVGFIHSHNVSPKQTHGAYWQALETSEIQRLLGNDFPGQPAGTAVASWPLVSCIMPTHNRRAFIPSAIQSFLSQDYPNKELVIVDDGNDAIRDLVAEAPGLCYFRLESRTSLGAKRNFACRQARGELIAHWDDDDWYAPNRLSYQVEPIFAQQADLTGLENSYMLELPGGQFWTLHPQLHQRMFVGDTHGGTLVFRKSLITDGLRYPEVNLAEDAGFLKQALQRGKRLTRLSNPGTFVYVRHGRNAWRFKTGQFLDPAGWQKIDPPPTFPANGLTAYQRAWEQL